MKVMDIVKFVGILIVMVIVELLLAVMCSLFVVMQFKEVTLQPIQHLVTRSIRFHSIDWYIAILTLAWTTVINGSATVPYVIFSFLPYIIAGVFGTVLVGAGHKMGLIGGFLSGLTLGITALLYNFQPGLFATQALIGGILGGLIMAAIGGAVGYVRRPKRFKVPVEQASN
jgi:hypothetical protein